MTLYIYLLYILKEAEMDRAKLFQNGNSQAVRLPKEFRFPGTEVRIYRRGNQVILEPLEPAWDSFFEALNEFPEDFFDSGRQQPPDQKREPL